MTSEEVKKYYDTGKIMELFKLHEKYFALIDKWADQMVAGNILTEFELKQCMEQSNGCQTKLNPVAGALQAMKEEYESNYQVGEETTFPNLRVQDSSSCKARAAGKVGDLRRYASDFTRYSFSAQNNVTMAQSLLKRLTVEKGNKGVDFTGEVPVDEPEAPTPTGGW